MPKTRTSLTTRGISMSDRELFYAVGVLMGALATVFVRWFTSRMFKPQPEARSRRR